MPSPSAQAAGSHWSTEIRLGYDSFSHDYRVIDRDTTNAFSEGSARISVGYRPGPDDHPLLETEAQFFLGRDYWQADLKIDRSLRSGRAWALRAEGDVRQYLSSSSLSFSNDHVQGEVEGRFRRALAPGVELEVGDRVAGIGYAERTDFFYDSITHDARASLRVGDILTHMLDLDLTHRDFFVPDSASIEYVSEALAAEYFCMPGATTMLTTRASVEWRRYAGGSPRSDFTRTESDLQFEWGCTDRTSLETSLDVAVERYGKNDPVYYDSETITLKAGPAFQVTDRWDVKVLPGAELYHVSPPEGDGAADDAEVLFYIQESYREFVLEVASDAFWLPRFWCDCTARVGHREYESSEAAIDSDYWYLDLSFLAEVTLWDGIRLDVTGLFSPEKHRNPEDNTATNVLSVYLGYRF